jgi:hypothetical protein
VVAVVIRAVVEEVVVMAVVITEVKVGEATLEEVVVEVEGAENRPGSTGERGHCVGSTSQIH